MNGAWFSEITQNNPLTDPGLPLYTFKVKVGHEIISLKRQLKEHMNQAHPLGKLSVVLPARHLVTPGRKHETHRANKVRQTDLIISPNRRSTLANPRSPLALPTE